MTLEELRAWRDTSPFRPFTIRVADGRSFRVRHRDYLLVSPRGRTIIVCNDDETCNVLDLLLVTELSVEAPAPAPGEQN